MFNDFLHANKHQMIENQTLAPDIENDQSFKALIKIFLKDI